MAINDAERKLAEYRKRKEREKVIHRYKEEIKGVFSKFKLPTRQNSQESSSIMGSEDEDVSDSCLLMEPIEENLEVTEPSPSWTVLDYVQCIILFLLWATVYVIFIQFQFGTVYLVVSAIIGMYLNTRTSPKKKNEISAYSVFNKNCESIDGTLDAEKMTRDMIYGGLSR
ncbi:hypothetical protein ABEB36_002213 [Hypothenemus hampei]|uniref:SAYSvFN domain-containing protein n=1 Tax=Hypothenemus hampei TaxID=57062 RepID=A0ABD1F8L0_HYPHA